MLLAYAAVMAVWANQTAAQHVCHGIEVRVEGNSVLDSTVRRGVIEELRHYPNPIEGTPLHQLRTDDIERYLSKANSFESVHCMVSSRGKLIVSVEPLVPVMRVFFADNSYYINKEGKHIVTNAEFFSDVPIVSGRFNRSFTPRDVVPLVNFISSDPMLSGLVSMVEAQNKDNLILVPRIRGHVINFGDTTRLDEKKRALALFYREVIPYKGWNEYDTISVKFKGQVVASRRDKSILNHSEKYEEEVDLEEATLPDGGTTGTGNAASDSTSREQQQKPVPQEPTTQG